MSLTIEVDATEVRELEADGRGRVTLGSDYASETVTLAVIKTDE